MIPIIVGAVVTCLVVGVGNNYEWYWGEAIFGALVGASVGLLAALVIGAALYTHTTLGVAPPVPLRTLADNTTTKGRFFLGSGIISGVSKYSWYEQTGPNSFQRKDVAADMATVHYIYPGQTPNYVVTFKETPKGFLHSFGINVSPGTKIIAHYDIYVPKGTITDTFKLDTQP